MSEIEKEREREREKESLRVFHKSQRKFKSGLCLGEKVSRTPHVHSWVTCVQVGVNNVTLHCVITPQCD